ncbi:O-acetyl-ADP-ribose deacetylase (regulator of RNase III) [Catalinimonas alkaloidigena]|uniref:macro domain-containing protein n=1 Tax=Catalinimonas alkaloidigena TaxID=1075417 RepID=UPI0024075982|nr:macro domain-containing protein [Catalinimonas alkaloidigena]MDF9800064.1 O-acetyl-ADP-ribose deacetylase (regulator of RNase III) [Catalinimonas alkaloidigena]
MEAQFSEIKLEVVQGDISKQSDMDAVVNAANAQLMSGGGVAGAIHRAAGPELADACRPLAPIAPGEAVITDAFQLPNRKVVHCLGPVYGRDKPEDQLLGSCYEKALQLADDYQLKSIAFPAISTGIFGYPLKEAAQVMLQTIQKRTEHLSSVRHIRIVLYGDSDRQQVEQTLKQMLS